MAGTGTMASCLRFSRAGSRAAHDVNDYGCKFGDGFVMCGIFCNDFYDVIYSCEDLCHKNYGMQVSRGTRLRELCNIAEAARTVIARAANPLP